MIYGIYLKLQGDLSHDLRYIPPTDLGVSGKIIGASMVPNMIPEGALYQLWQ